MLLKPLLAAPGSFAKTVPLLSAAGATQVQQIFASFFFSSPSSCPVAIKRPVYYETWPPCHCCYWLFRSQPQALGTYRPKALPRTAGPCLPGRRCGPQVQRGHGGTCDHTASGLLPLPAASGGSGLAGREGLLESPKEPPLLPCRMGLLTAPKRKSFFLSPN